MTTLHILNKSSLKHDATIDCLRSVDKGDAILLIEDGVYLSQRSHIAKRAISIYALQHDLHMRGLSPMQGRIQIVDDAGFVDLCGRFDKTISWF